MLPDFYSVTCSVCLRTVLVTYCFSWASRSLTSASRLLTSMTSSSSSSCSRLFWASVFCQSATTPEEQTASEQETLRTKNPEILWIKRFIFLFLAGTFDRWTTSQLRRVSSDPPGIETFLLSSNETVSDTLDFTCFQLFSHITGRQSFRWSGLDCVEMETSAMYGRVCRYDV